MQGATLKTSKNGDRNNFYDNTVAHVFHGFAENRVIHELVKVLFKVALQNSCFFLNSVFIPCMAPSSFLVLVLGVYVLKCQQQLIAVWLFHMQDIHQTL